MPYGIDKLIINSPFDEPKNHWKYRPEEKKFELAEGRRPAGYVRASGRSRSFDEPGEFVDIPLVNKIRPRVKKWREEGYPGVTTVTKRLLEFWNDTEFREDKRFFFAQIEAIETIIWLTEAPDREKVGIEIPSDGGDFVRWCSKMATGTGKTVVMAMVIAWNIINKATYAQDTRFSKNVLIVTPGLTVKERLQVLIPDSKGNYYDEFNVFPPDFREKMRMGKIKIINWHVLAPLDESKGPRVMKKGPESDEAFARRVLGDMAKARNILVINDEAHHAWRVPPESKVKGPKKGGIEEEATVWIGGLDRINRVCGIQKCHDFSATPFAPTGKRNTDEMLYGWIVSDFGLNDAIESGLVKTPRVVIRDDSQMKDFRSKFYHIYEHVKDDLNRKAAPEEPLPDLVQHAYYFLGLDWLATYKEWKKEGHKIPPVMITVCNRTETAARVYHSFVHKRIRIDELAEKDKILHIDSKVLKKADTGIPGRSSNAKRAEELRRKVSTVGKEGEPGEQVRLVISVGMLSEGWDAKTVTQILGLRAFSSQLLCEQVVGRGLRRTSYEINTKTGLYDPEYVNIFGIPFSFIPHEGEAGTPKPAKPKVMVRPLEEKKKYEIEWPNVIRINRKYKPRLTLDIENMRQLIIKVSKTPTLAEMAPVIEGKPDVTKISDIDLEKLSKEYRLQKVIFETAVDVYNKMKPDWKGNTDYLLAQVIRLAGEFIKSDKIVFDTIWAQSEMKRKLLIILNMSAVVQHIFDAIKFENAEEISLVLDNFRPIKSTSDMGTWYTGKPCELAKKSHISHVVYDSTWEKNMADELDRNKNVLAWVKNDHLGFEILYIDQGIVRKYRPDFLVRLKNDLNLIIEVKGRKRQKDTTKEDFLREWIEAVNSEKRFGRWEAFMVENLADMKQMLDNFSA